MSAPTVRFAPSPTGYIHLGNLRPALLNWCIAKRDGGRFILRYDDTDTERSKDEYARAIAEDLAWFGVKPDHVFRQSDRLGAYAEAASRLKAAGRLYACYETPDELDRKRKRQLGRGQPPVYDRAALKLTPEQKAEFEAQGRKPHWRFLLNHRQVTWDDGIRGPSHIDSASLSDPVLIRADGTILYTFASVVDDAETGVTLVLRGEDHVTNTAVQIELFEALGAKPPAFAHHNLLVDASGEGFSKRAGSLSITTLRQQGYEPMAVAALAVLTGTAEAVRPVRDLDELASLVALDTVSRAPARFDPAELGLINARLLHAMDYATAAPRLAAMGITGGEAFWLAVRGNLEHFSDAALWWSVIEGHIEPIVAPEEQAYVQSALAALPALPWDQATWGAWTSALKASTGRKGRALFMPLRLALTGRDHGPELAALLPLIGRQKAAARLAGQSA
jgi:glutamyl-tRNA synthetase